MDEWKSGWKAGAWQSAGGWLPGASPPLLHSSSLPLFQSSTHPFIHPIIHDLYSKENITKLVELGTRVLDKGEHRFVVEIVGTNPQAEPRHMLGLDYLRLQEIP